MVYILFKNFYVASISLIAYCGNETYNLLNNYTIMNDPNTEEDSERHITASKAPSRGLLLVAVEY